MRATVVHPTAIRTGHGNRLRIGGNFECAVCIRNFVVARHILCTTFDNGIARDVVAATNCCLSTRHRNALHHIGRSDVGRSGVVPSIVGKRSAVVFLGSAVGRDDRLTLGDGERAVHRRVHRVAGAHIHTTVADGPVCSDNIRNAAHRVNGTIDIHMEDITVEEVKVTVRTHLIGSAVEHDFTTVLHMEGAIVSPSTTLSCDGNLRLRRLVRHRQFARDITYGVVVAATAHEVVADDGVRLRTLRRELDTARSHCRQIIRTDKTCNGITRLCLAVTVINEYAVCCCNHHRTCLNIQRTIRPCHNVIIGNIMTMVG